MSLFFNVLFAVLVLAMIVARSKREKSDCGCGD